MSSWWPTSFLTSSSTTAAAPPLSTSEATLASLRQQRVAQQRTLDERRRAYTTLVDEARRHKVAGRQEAARALVPRIAAAHAIVAQLDHIVHALDDQLLTIEQTIVNANVAALVHESRTLLDAVSRNVDRTLVREDMRALRTHARATSKTSRLLGGALFADASSADAEDVEDGERTASELDAELDSILASTTTPSNATADADYDNEDTDDEEEEEEKDETTSRQQSHARNEPSRTRLRELTAELGL